MTKSSHAWLLTIDDGVQLAVADHEIREYVLSPAVHCIPLTPRYCSHIIYWRESMLPVVDFLALLGKTTKPNLYPAIAMVAYQYHTHTPLNYVGIWIHQPPLRIMVSDDQVCELPKTDNGLWHETKLPLTCFSYNDAHTPVINIAYLCSEMFRESVKAAIDMNNCGVEASHLTTCVKSKPYQSYLAPPEVKY